MPQPNAINVHLTKEQVEYVNAHVAEQFTFLDAVLAEAAKPKPDIDVIVSTFEQSAVAYDKVTDPTLALTIKAEVQFHEKTIKAQAELDKLIPLFQEREKPEIKSKDGLKLQFQGEIATPTDAINSMIEQNGKAGVADIHQKPAILEDLAQNIPNIKGNTVWTEYLDHNGNKPGPSFALYDNGTKELYENFLASAAKAGKKIVGIDTRTGLFPSEPLRMAISNHEWNKRIGEGTGLVIGGLGHFYGPAGGRTDELAPMPVFIGVKAEQSDVIALDDKSLADFAITLPYWNAPTVEEINAAAAQAIPAKSPSELPAPPNQLKR